MIIRFGVGNFKSLRSYNELSFVASKLADGKDGLIDVEGMADDLLPSLAIYGSNASGKSNVISAINWMRGAVRQSHSNSAENPGIPRNVFRLDENAKSEDSRFDIDFIYQGIRYHYGFICDDEQFKSEWLYAFPKGKRQTWFVRDETGIDFGPNLPGKNKFVSEQMRPNALFLSTASAANHKKLSEVAQFFQRDLKFEAVSDVGNFESYISLEATKRLTMALLSSADFGISNVKFEAPEHHPNTLEMIEDFRKVIKRHIPDYEEPHSSKEIRLGHNASDGAVVYLDKSDESTGTIRLLELIGPILRCLANGSVLVIDEIDSSLHSAISNNLIKLFSNKNINHKNAQLLFSTHDTNLLCGGGLRRDQIWFAEKDAKGETVIYPLTDITTRKGDNVERGYLQGRYGAIPFMGDWQRLLEDAVQGGELSDELSS